MWDKVGCGRHFGWDGMGWDVGWNLGREEGRFGEVGCDAGGMRRDGHEDVTNRDGSRDGKWNRRWVVGWDVWDKR